MRLNVIIICFFSFFIKAEQNKTNQEQESLKYFGQKPPSLVPEVFASKIISKKNVSEFGAVFNKNGTEFFYGIDVNGKSEIWHTKLCNKTWSKPQRLIAKGQFSCNDPFLSPDENKLYFITNKAINNNKLKKDYDIWYIEKLGNQWNRNNFINAGYKINTAKNEYYISFTESGNIYFSSNKNTTEANEHDYNIYTSEFRNGTFKTAEMLGPSINTKAYEADVFIDPKESYIIFCSIRKEGYGKGDLYISFKDPEGNWSKAKNLGSSINTKGHELCPFVTKDGKYLFYTSNEDIYWVDATIINSFKYN